MIKCKILWMVLTCSVTVVATLGSCSASEEPASAAQHTDVPAPPNAILKIEVTGSNYSAASGQTSGFFKTGQEADIMLSGIDFNNAGGPLLFNHPSGLASDGTRLFLADTFNNRVLIWNSIPEGNLPPDLVLGQKDFVSNDPGSDRNQMNWPINVATDGKRLLVADVFNDRVLIWNSIPLTCDEPADIILQGTITGQLGTGISKSSFVGPWGIWTDGSKLAVSNTWGGGSVLIWNTFPTVDNQPADIVLTANGKMGTPRHITSDGTCLIVGDHNARVEGEPQHGSFFWKTFPTMDEQPYDFYMSRGAWLRGTFTQDGRLLLFGDELYIWNRFPQSADDSPILSVQSSIPDFRAGDYESMVVADGKLFISLGNGNRVVVFNSVPTQTGQVPDFAIGSPDVQTNTLTTNYFIQNASIASNGNNLFVSSDFDRKLYVWRNLPNQSGAYPDIVYTISGEYAPWDVALSGNTLALAGKTGVIIWRNLPLNGEMPDLVFTRDIGSIKFLDLQGVALDNRYFYLGDGAAGKVYVWEGLPSPDSEPKYLLETAGPFGGLDSDGRYLVIARSFNHVAEIYRVAELGQQVKPVVVGQAGWFNNVSGAATAKGHLFVSDGNNRVAVWRNIEEAMNNKWPPDAIIGVDDPVTTTPEIGRDRLFWPRSICFDGSYLWLGEFKFSNRILRFSPFP